MEEQTITAALKAEVNQIHLPGELLQRIQQEASSWRPGRSNLWARLRIGAKLEIAAACILLVSMVAMAGVLNSHRKQSRTGVDEGQGVPTVPPEASAPVPAAVKALYTTHGWTVGDDAIASEEQLPTDFKLRSGRFPWRVFLDLSIDAGLDFSSLAGTRVKTLRVPVNNGLDERLKEIRTNYQMWGVTLLNDNGHVIGAWLTYTDKQGETLDGIAGYSLRARDLREVTGLEWSEYTQKYGAESPIPKSGH